MTRLLLALVLAVSLAGCGEEKKSDTPTTPAPDASIFDKKDVPKSGKKSGPKGD
jgi:hypothetical protein